MKFFKHFTDAHEGKSMMALMSEFGLEGYAAFFILTELCAKKLEKGRSETYTAEHCKFIFNERILREKLRMRSTKVELFLNSCATKDLLLFTKVEDEIHLSFPKLLESLDRDTVRARPERGVAAPKNKSKNKSKNKIYKNSEIEGEGSDDPLETPVSPSHLLFCIWNENRGQLPEALALTKKRESAAKQRWKEVPDEDYWRGVVVKMASSPFHCGHNDRNWRADFDFFLKPDTHVKITERGFGHVASKNSTMGVIGG